MLGTAWCSTPANIPAQQRRAHDLIVLLLGRSSPEFRVRRFPDIVEFALVVCLMELSNRLLGGRLAFGETSTTDQSRHEEHHQSDLENFQEISFLAVLMSCVLSNAKRQRREVSRARAVIVR